MYDMYSDLPYGQYIWNGTLGDVQEYVSKIPDGETLDIRRCRFDPSCISVVMNNIPRIKVINSEEEDLNLILSHNYEVKTLDKSSIERRNIKAEFHNDEGRDIASFLREIVASPKEVVWQIPSGAAMTRYFKNYMNVLLGALIQFPKRRFDIYNEYPGQFIENAQAYFKLDDYLHYPTIFVVVGGGVLMPIKYDDAEVGSAHINGIGHLEIDDLIMKYHAIPGWVGVEKVFGTEREAILNKIYSDVQFAERIEADSEAKTMRSYISKYGGMYE